jgi:hypothetical protein
MGTPRSFTDHQMGRPGDAYGSSTHRVLKQLARDLKTKKSARVNRRVLGPFQWPAPFRYRRGHIEIINLDAPGEFSCATTQGMPSMRQSVRAQRTRCQRDSLVSQRR